MLCQNPSRIAGSSRSLHTVLSNSNTPQGRGNINTREQVQLCLMLSFTLTKMRS